MRMRLIGDQGNGFDFDQRAQGQLGDGHSGSGRGLLGEKCAVNAVDHAKIGHIGDEDGGFDDGVEASARGLQHGLEIGHDLPGLRLQSFLHLARGRVDADLSGSVDQIADFDGLRVGADRGGSVLGVDDLSGHDGTPVGKKDG